MPARLIASTLTALLLGATTPAALASNTSGEATTDPGHAFTSERPDPAPEDDDTGSSPVKLTWASRPGDRVINAHTGTARKAVVTYGHKGCKRVTKANRCKSGTWARIRGAAWIGRAKKPRGPHPDLWFYKTIKTDLNLDCTMRVLADGLVEVSRYREGYGLSQIVALPQHTSPSKVHTFDLSLTPDTHQFVFALSDPNSTRNRRTNPSGLAWKISGCRVTPTPSFNDYEIREAINRDDLEAPHALLRFGVSDMDGNPSLTSDGINPTFRACSGTLVGEPGTQVILSAGHCPVPGYEDEQLTWWGTAYFGASVSPSGRFQYLYRCNIGRYYTPYIGDETDRGVSARDWAVLGIDWCWTPDNHAPLDYALGTPAHALRPYPLGDFPINDQTYNGYFATYPVMPPGHEPYPHGHLINGAWPIETGDDDDHYVSPDLMTMFTPEAGTQPTVAGGASGSGMIFDPANPHLGGILTAVTPKSDPTKGVILKITDEIREAVDKAGRGQWGPGTVIYEH